jgi:poly(3-hydroxybutyrate) depolymerase
MADTPTDVAEKKSAAPAVLDKPPTELGAQATKSLTSRDADAPRTGATEAAKNNANSIYGTLELIGVTSAAGNPQDQASAPAAKPDATAAKPDGTAAKPDGTAAKPDATAAKPDATGAKLDATGAKPDATNTTVADNPLMDGAHEVVKDKAGNDTLIPLGKLGPGDHTIMLADNREFLMHVPPNDGTQKLPVMFMFSGSAEGQWNIKDFMPESGMNTKANDPKNPFIAVYPLPQRHLLGTGSDKTAYGWNVLDKNGGVLIDKADSAKAGYDDTDYVKDIAKLLPQVANVDATHKDWAATGFSQGGVFLNYLASNVPDLFPTVDLVGTAVDKNYNYDVKPGNAQNVDIVNLRGDKDTLPFLNNSDAKFKTEEVLRDTLPKSLFEKMDDLAPIDNAEADPQKQMTMYENRLGKSTTQTTELSTPIASQNAKDNVTVFKPLDPNNHNQLTEVNYIEALHSFPEADPTNKHTNAQTKYAEIDTDQQIVNNWMNFNKEQTK